ncbi:MAG: cyanophycinase [Firmicutes bacterium]|nr:cyanophycinase [Bacillota bacterium]
MGREEKPEPRGLGRGPLVIIGGAEDREGAILRRFVELAGGSEAVVAVLATASDRPELPERAYEEAFRRLGARRVVTLRVSGREDAGRPEILDRAGEATGFFFTGGDQLRITSTIGGTLLDSLLHRRLRDGAVVAGTSAGASAMSETMIVEGPSDDAPKKCTIKMAPGMGFLEGTVVDQHFAQRGRLGRLLAAVAQNPKVLGLGVDEDTAAIVTPDDKLWVAGSQTVTVVDGRGILETNASESLPDEPLTLTGVVLHVLPRGWGFDLVTRHPLKSCGTASAAEAGPLEAGR